MNFVRQPPKTRQPIWIGVRHQMRIFKWPAVVHLAAHLGSKNPIRLREAISGRPPGCRLRGFPQTARGLVYRCLSLPRLSLKEIEWPLKAVLDGASGRRNTPQSDAGSEQVGEPTSGSAHRHQDFQRRSIRQARSSLLVSKGHPPGRRTVTADAATACGVVEIAWPCCPRRVRSVAGGAMQ